MQEMSGVQITMSFWKSILSTVPDFFELLETFKNYSYYHDIVARDLKFTDEALVITPPDELCRELDQKLQEKQIPFIKGTSELAGDNVRASGFYTYYCRTMDYDRIDKVVQEINARVLEEAEKAAKEKEEAEKDLEPEKTKEEDTAQAEELGDEKEVTGEAPDEPEETEEEIPEKEEEETGKKKKKEKKTGDTSFVYPDTEREAQERKEQAAREERDRKEREQREREESYRQEINARERQEREAGRSQEYKEKREYEDVKYREEELKKAESRREENGTSSFSSGRYEQVPIQKPHQEEIPVRGSEARRSEGADADSRIAAGFGGHSGFYRTDAAEEQQEPQRDYVQPHTGANPVRTSYETSHHSDITQDRYDPYKGGVYSPESTGYKESYQEEKTYEPQPEYKRGKDDINSSRKEEPPSESHNHTRGYVKRDNLASGRRDIQVDFTHASSSTEASSQTAKPKGGVQLLGTAEMLNGEIPSKGSAGFITRAWGGTNAGAQQADLQSEHKDFNLGSNSESKQDNRKSYIEQIEMPKKPDKASDINRKKIINNAKEVISPKHFKQLAKSTNRLVSQTVISRETEGGRVANEIIDNVSPVAAAMMATMMSNGAINQCHLV